MSKIQDALIKMRADGRRSDSSDASAQPVRVEPVVAMGQVIGSDRDELAIDLDALESAGLMPPEYHKNVIADQFREIKRPLIANAYGKRVARIEDGNVIMVTSSVAGEGKTFTSINLAFSIAQELDISVLLVDGDVAKPHISDAVGVSEMPGLLDYLTGRQESLEALVIPTSVDGLSILPAGEPNSNATELLSGSRMEDMILQLARNYPQRMIIFDTPPLLQTSESKVLASLARQIVLVVRAGSTPVGAVSDALQILGEDKAVNLVLNQFRSFGKGDQYQYGYGYGLQENQQVEPTEGSTTI